MELKTCKRCGEEWCFHGIGRPIRCGKCKSPYWDRERRNEQSYGLVERSVPPTDINRTPNFTAPPPSDLTRMEELTDRFLAQHPEVETDSMEMCSYTEYDPETGETYRCGRPVHGPKVKHTRGEKL